MSSDSAAPRLVAGSRLLPTNEQQRAEAERLFNAYWDGGGWFTGVDKQIANEIWHACASYMK